MSRLLGLLCITMLSGPALAGVNPKNGNFYISYTDLAIDGAHKLDIVRTYNSKSAYVGWFGPGWGSKLESRLTIMPDETAVITENGSGVDSIFHDENHPRDREKIKQGIDRIVQVATERQKLSPDAATEMGRNLMRDEEARINAVRKFGIKSDFPLGVELSAIGRGYCAGTLTHGAMGYKRDNGCGTIQEFDSDLRLIQVSESDGYRIEMRYDGGTRPVEIADTLGRHLYLYWTQAGQVYRIESDQGCSSQHCQATYQYDDSRNLLESLDFEGNHYWYEYDNNTNLIRVRYVDKSSMYITYDRNSAATSVTERTGERKLYEYREDPQDSNHLYTRIRTIHADGQEEVDDQEYRQQYSDTGERAALAYSQTHNGSEVSTEVDEKGRVVRKTYGEGQFIAYTYNPENGKVASVNLSDEMSAQYFYNANGELIRAESSTGLQVGLEYDRKKRISAMRSVGRDQKNHLLRIKYNQAGKPVELKQDKLAPVLISYDSEGEIANVQCASGAESSLAITQSMQTLMMIVKMAELP